MSDQLEANREVVRRLIQEGFNDGNLDVVGELVSPQVVTHNPIILDAPSGPDSIRGGIEMIHNAFTDISVELRDTVAEGDKVATFLQITGTNVGEYRRARLLDNFVDRELENSGHARDCASLVDLVTDEKRENEIVRGQICFANEIA